MCRPAWGQALAAAQRRKDLEARDEDARPPNDETPADEARIGDLIGTAAS
ncbi:hypothetical protein ACGFYU_21995 [Streptomyces sp. NPDC048337]